MAERPERVDEAEYGRAQAAPSDTVDQLERLAELREQNILSEEEFRAEKRKLIHG
jgi:hypothetical protein